MSLTNSKMTSLKDQLVADEVEAKKETERVRSEAIEKKEEKKDKKKVVK